MRQACVSPLLLPADSRSAILDKKFETGAAKTINKENNFNVVKVNDGTEVPETQQPILPQEKIEIRSLKELCARVVVQNYIMYNEENIPEEVKNIINGIKVTLPAIYSTKITMLLEYLKAIPPEDKCLVFSEWTSIFGPLAAVLSSEGYHWVKIEGTQSVEERQRNMIKFETHKKVKVMLSSLRIVCNGLTLVAANHCLFLEPWWNPYVHIQAQARAHRTGQTKQVYSVYFVIDKTIEQRVLAISAEKKNLSEQMLSGAVTGKRKNVHALDRETLMRLIGDDDD